MVDNKSALLLLFDRPKEPIFKEKGEDKVILDVPKNFISERFQSVETEVVSRFGDDDSQHYGVQAISRLPDLKFADKLGRDKPFSLWIPLHSRVAGKLIEIFMGKVSLSACIKLN